MESSSEACQSSINQSCVLLRIDIFRDRLLISIQCLINRFDGVVEIFRTPAIRGA